MGSGKHTVISRPVAREEDLLVETVDGDAVVYDLRTKQVHCLKTLAAVVFTTADGTKTAADLAELASYQLAQPVSEADVQDVVLSLEESGLLNSSTLDDGHGVSRRQALKTFAAAGAGAALITTIAAPAALAAGSQIATGNCCGNSATSACEGLNPTCASGHCCQNNGGKQCTECKCVGDKNDCETGASCTTNANCPTGQECITTGQGTGYCCTVFESTGGGVLSC
jgi:hypothetical protein